MRPCKSLWIVSKIVFQLTHPSRGATSYRHHISRKVLLFQLTHPSRGATLLPLTYPEKTKFQLTGAFFHTRVGCDKAKADAVAEYNISTHAPAWGATVRSASSRHCRLNFNSRTRVGCDTAVCGGSLQLNDFNSRTRVGCDLRFRLLGAVRRDFNSRTRVGCDAKP